MAATGYTPIYLYYSSTTSNTPSAGNLGYGELAINITDKNLFFKDNGNVVNTVPIRQSSGSSDGWLSSTDWTTFNSKQAALVSGTNIKTVSGNSLLGSGDVGTIGVGYGGTGKTSWTANGILYASGTATLANGSALTFDGTNFATTGTVTSAGISNSGNLAFTGTGNRITGDFNNAILANRPLFQSSISNDPTSVGVIPNGTAVSTNFAVFNSSDTANSSIGTLSISSAATIITSTQVGTGTYLPMTFQTGGAERMRIDTSGGVMVGSTSLPASGKFAVYGGRTFFGANSETYSFGFAYSKTRLNSGHLSYIGATDSATPSIVFSNETGAERMRIASAGQVSIGTGADGTALLTIAAGGSAANTGPLKFTSGTNLGTPEAGVVEYDGTVMTATSNTNFKRGTIPITNYASGVGTALTKTSESTLRVLLPSANDTITLSAGTYFIDLACTFTRGTTSTTSATARINILGTGNAAGNFSGMSLSAPTAGGATANFSFSAVNINTSNVVTAASTSASGVYTITLRGMLKITTGGTIIPQYNLSANLTSAGTDTAPNVLYFILQQIDSQNAAAFGPAGTGWG